MPGVGHCIPLMSTSGHSLPIHLAPVPANVRYSPIATFQGGVLQHIPPDSGSFRSRQFDVRNALTDPPLHRHTGKADRLARKEALSRGRITGQFGSMPAAFTASPISLTS